MNYEYIVLGVVAVMAWQNFSLRRQLKKLWLVVDKTHYINRYLEILNDTKDQSRAIKQLRQEFTELSLLQALQVSQIAHTNIIKDNES